MRFLHTADVHLGATPDREFPWGEERAKAIWNTFHQIIDTAGKQHVDLLLIAGDFFHRQPKQSECKEVNYLFSSIPDTRIVIIAGNHDYIRDTSPYLHYAWNSNVTFLSSENMSSVYFEELNTEVHGFSYHRPEITEPLYDHIRAPKDGRCHILLAHGGDERHIPIHMNRLANSGFDYIALGHIHQPKLAGNAPIAYSGSPEPMDRTDMGHRGYILGEIRDQSCKFHWYPCASAEYAAITMTVTRETTTTQIIDSLKANLPEDSHDIFRIILDGSRDPDIHFDIDQILTAGRIVDVTDRTVPEYDLQHLEEEHAHDLISYYIQRLSGPDAGETEKKALYYGLRALLNPED